MDIKDIHININRKASIKNINLKVCPPDGRVEVTIPLDMDDGDVRAFVIRKLSWIKSKQKSMAEQIRQTERDYEGSETHYFLGNRYRLKIIEKTVVPHTVTLEGEWLIMTVHPGTTAKNRGELLWEFYRSKLKDIIAEMVTAKATEFGESDVTWEIKRMRTEWGSCLVKRRHLLFNLELARLPIRCIEYIVVHELTHLKERLHNDNFIKLMTNRMPTWQTIRQELNRFPSTKYEYTPDWKGEIKRISDVVNERSIVNLAMTLSVLRICLLGEVQNEDFILSENNDLLSRYYSEICPLQQNSFSDALRLCGDTEYYKRFDSGLCIKSLWINTLLENRDFLEDVEKYCCNKLESLLNEYRKNAASIEPIESFAVSDNKEEIEAKYSIDKKTLIRVSRKVKYFSIPEGTRIIGSNAFAGCKELTEVIIPDSIVRIEPSAFRGCISLEELNIPTTVMKVGTDAFKDTNIDSIFTDDIYRNQGYFTPSILESLLPNAIMVYAGKTDQILAQELLGIKRIKKYGLNGKVYSLSDNCSWKEFTEAIDALLLYAKEHENLRFIFRQSVYSEWGIDKVAELFEDFYENDNLILPYELYQAVDELVNRKIKIDPVAKYKYGGVINFSYEVNALNISSDQKENKKLQQKITKYNHNHAKEMLLPLCKRFNTGMSIHPNAGLYIGEDDQFYDEGSFEVRIIGVNSSQLKKIAEEICSMFIQESVLVRDEIQKTIYFLYAPILNVRQHPALKHK